MTRTELLSRISINPNICFGKPCIRGHRIWVSLILDFLASGWTVQDILDEYPGLEEADVLACIAYGAEMARERYFEIPLETQTRDSSWTRTLAGVVLSFYARRGTRSLPYRSSISAARQMRS